jgi:cytochrome c5
MKKIVTVVAAMVMAGSASSVLAASGEETYNTYCHVCHAAGVAGAPKFGDKEAWAPRIAQGMDVLLQSATNGKNAMPPKGTCMSCTEDDLKAAIGYMVSHAQ